MIKIGIYHKANISCRHSIAARHWGEMADLPGISTDNSFVLNFGKEVEYTL